MSHEQRLFARVRFLERMGELYETAFEDFFHNLMCARYPDFLDVRTHGKLGDQGSDGLSLHDRKLYACYAPQGSKSAGEIKAKFSSDLKKAKEKRRGEFSTFVFVHSDRRGMHPEISSLLAAAKTDDPELDFEQIGIRRLWQECMRLDLEAAEDILDCEIPVRPVVYGIGMEDLSPLLKHLRELRAKSDPLISMNDVPPTKMDYNRLDEEAREDLQKGRRQAHLVEAFYTGSFRELEHDEVAEGFRIYYEQLKGEWGEPEEVLWQLEMYVLGNQRHHPKVHRAAWVVLAHFFDRCDIFETPPPGWSAHALGVSA
ncbi:ABC-three component system protein [Streptomyces sp. NPDC001194]|uniref:ABC-three component system protein n=1 Tax=Streptomyces sp. NPDC001194 TaxID=3364547 RepID=UPI0036866F46